MVESETKLMFEKVCCFLTFLLSPVLIYNFIFTLSRLLTAKIRSLVFGLCGAILLLLGIYAIILTQATPYNYVYAMTTLIWCMCAFLPSILQMFRMHNPRKDFWNPGDNLEKALPKTRKKVEFGIFMIMIVVSFFHVFFNCVCFFFFFFSKFVSF